MRCDPTTPVNERIAQALCERIANVQIDDGFNTDVEDVERPRAVGIHSPRDRRVIVEQIGLERATAYDAAGNPPIKGYRVTFSLSLYRQQSNKDETPIDTLVNQFRADVEEAITADQCDGYEWHNFGGLSILADVDPGKDFVHTNGAFSGTELLVVIAYRLYENDPFTAVLN